MKIKNDKVGKIAPFIDDCEAIAEECPECFSRLTGKIVLYKEFDADYLCEDEYSFGCGPQDSGYSSQRGGHYTYLDDTLSCDEFLEKTLNTGNLEYEIEIGASENSHVIRKNDLTKEDCIRFLEDIEKKLRAALPEGTLVLNTD